MNKLLASTAIVAMTALPLAAQTATETTETTAPESTGSMATDAPAASSTDTMTAPDAAMDTQDTADAAATMGTDTMGGSDFSYMPTGDEVMASDFLGKRLYTAEGDVDTAAINEADANWDDIGEVSDIIMNPEGQAQAVLVDIGGFLGIGEKTVAVSMDQLSIVPDGDNAGDFFVAFSSSREALENAPEFDMGPMDAQQNADAGMAADTGMGAGAGMSGTDTAAMDTTAPAADGTTDQDMAATTTTAADPAMTDSTATAPAATDMAATDATGEAGMEEAVDPNTLTAEMLQGAPVYDANDERIGDVSQLVVADDGTITHTVIDIGGFLGIGAKPVALDFEQMEVMTEDGGETLRVHVTATEEELEQMPEYQG
ncbi:PRC-barrel domain-containing protein [Frigidibacter oleivorans]|uniref:PRC-barrel domain-containing protein n=1 Tax=Frigidibacter oleivorans TaxID=2487129 RepID=UPI000F8D32F3|nr:PRC-barrel domain-containing protein [Frigidibacter oleivorans]